MATVAFRLPRSPASRQAAASLLGARPVSVTRFPSFRTQTLGVRPVSVTRFPSFRTQTLESLSLHLRTNGLLSNPDPGENLARPPGSTASFQNFEFVLVGIVSISFLVLVRYVRPVFRISKLFLRPRPWQFETIDSTDT